MAKGYVKWGCFVYVVLVGFKHIFLYMAPGYFSFLVFNYLISNGKIRVLTIIQLLFIGLITTILIFLPFYGDNSSRQHSSAPAAFISLRSRSDPRLLGSKHLVSV